MTVRQPIIDSGVLRLRDFAASDVPLVQSASQTSIPDSTTVPRTAGVPEALAYIERQLDRLPSGTGYACAMARTIDDVAVGYIGLQLRDVDSGRASLGYWVGPHQRGDGYAALALRALSDWSDATLAIARLELYVEPSNIASCRTAEAAGFEREGLLRSWRVVGDSRRDMWMYSRIRDA
ncbi:GNAT family protein [Aeromicrobium sp.]|uniref:GNAT family N-acetyltransferase n=1 Tax=Aeromicrobium sp. TaxID=1871063 RepID=UPI00198865D5|nr:GNAT family protein [Aeromicrobium sp.]MBC7632585.1 GNAT family N-acetyltransferase [Aeromicrobium sp.]